MPIMGALEHENTHYMVNINQEVTVVLWVDHFLNLKQTASTLILINLITIIMSFI